MAEFTAGQRVRVVACRDGWTDRFRNHEGIVKWRESDGGLVVHLDGGHGERVFFEDELAPVEDAPHDP